MGMAASLDHDNWTVAKLHELPDDGNRYEIIDGVLYVTPAPRAIHQVVLGELHLLLGPYAKTVGLQVLLSPADIIFSDRTLVQPDLFAFPAFKKGTPREYKVITHLTLAMEAISPSSARVDRTIKRRLYQAQGVTEYWIVDADARTVERWLPDADRSDTFTTEILWQPRPDLVALRIDLVDLFATVFGE
jgi:Uma2 family endonuclease